MKKFFVVGFLAVAALWAAGDGLAQQGKRSGGSAAKAGTIEIVESRDGKFRFNVRDADGKYLGGSTVGHETDKEAREAVEELKRVLATATYVKKKSEGATEKAKGDKKDRNDK